MHPDPQYADLYQRLDAIGCVVHFTSFELGEADGTQAAIHRAVALRTLEAERDRIDRDFAQLLLRPGYEHHQRADFFRVQIDADRLGPGERISRDHFLGPGCDLAGRRVLQKGQSSRHRNDLFWGGDVEAPGNIVKADLGENFTYAFLEPPHRLSRSYPDGGPRLTNLDKQAIYFETIDRLFGGLPDDCVIFRWSDDASNYFDDGKEWWGTFFYTVYAPQIARMVGVVASTTD